MLQLCEVGRTGSIALFYSLAINGAQRMEMTYLEHMAQKCRWAALSSRMFIFALSVAHKYRPANFLEKGSKRIFPT